MKTFFLLMLAFTFSFQQIFEAQQKPLGNFVEIKSGASKEEIIRIAANVTPKKSQYEWQKLEFTVFIHFGINTFYNLEWGKPALDISIFNPTELDVNQWVSVLKKAGCQLIIFTTKHHDGFCQWQTNLTDYSIKNTPYKNGKGDIVRDLSNACKKAGVKFGIYLSPWDMNEKTYGTDDYNKYFAKQLTELLTKYGEVTEVWFDGACGEGPNGKKQVYDWQLFYKTVRTLQPNAVIFGMAPDLRWVGNEEGSGRKSEWSVVPALVNEKEFPKNFSQQEKLDDAFSPRDLMGDDLGSREKIYNAKSLAWYPAETDVSIRPGWFYHSEEDGKVKSVKKLIDIYYSSVGQNGNLLLNIPPEKRGLIHENDIKSLVGMKNILDETFKNNFVRNAKVFTQSSSKNTHPKNIVDESIETYWAAGEKDSNAVIDFDLTKEAKFNVVMLQENVLVGQRIEKFHLEFWNGKSWEVFAEGTTVGYKRLLRFPEVTAKKIKLVIEQSRLNPTLASFGLFYEPKFE